MKGQARGGMYFNAWFPDGATVLFTDTGPDSSELKLWNTVSGSKTTLVARGSSGALSTDGRYVAFIAPETPGNKQASLAILDLRSKKIVASTEIPNVLAPVQWSPSANHLAILARDGKLLLATLTARGIQLGQRELSKPDFYHELSWSPDGKYLAAWDEASGLKIFAIN